MLGSLGRTTILLRSLIWNSIALLPAIIPLCLILRFGINFPFWDQWYPGVAGLYIKAHQGQLAFADFTAQHNEHRILIPRLIFFGINSITHWNTLVEMIAGWIVVVLTAFGIVSLIYSTTSAAASGQPARQGWQSILLATVCSLLLFTPAQAENWLWGMGLANFLPGLFVIAALVTAARPTRSVRIQNTIVILCCSAATFSSGSGVVSWPLAAMLMAWSSSRAELRSKLPSLLVIGVAVGINAGLYLVHFVRPESGQVDYYAGSAGHMLQFFAAFLGNPFAKVMPSDAQTVATVIGLILLTLLASAATYFLYSWRRRRDYVLCHRMLIWFAVAGYALLSAALAARARVGLGLTQAVASRYVTFSVYLPVALVPLSWLVLQDLRKRQILSSAMIRSIGGAMVLGLLLLQAMAIPDAISYSRVWENSRKREKGVLLLLPVMQIDRNLIQSVAPNPNDVVTQAPLLNQLGFLHPPLIQDPDAARIESTRPFAQGRLEKILQDSSGAYFAVGWAILTDRARSADAIFIAYDDSQGQPIIFAAGVTGAQSPGAIPELARREYQFAGWAAPIPLDRLPQAVQKTRLTAWALDTETGKACRLENSVDVVK